MDRQTDRPTDCRMDAQTVCTDSKQSRLIDKQIKRATGIRKEIETDKKRDKQMTRERDR
jgi:hypothetical protein